MKKSVVFTNNFHNSKAVSRKKVGDIVSQSYINRIADKLCGMNCTCGGLRGSQFDFVQINAEGDHKIIQNWV